MLTRMGRLIGGSSKCFSLPPNVLCHEISHKTLLTAIRCLENGKNEKKFNNFSFGFQFMYGSHGMLVRYSSFFLTVVIYYFGCMVIISAS